MRNSFKALLALLPVQQPRYIHPIWHRLCLAKGHPEQSESAIRADGLIHSLEERPTGPELRVVHTTHFWSRTGLSRLSGSLSAELSEHIFRLLVLLLVHDHLNSESKRWWYRSPSDMPSLCGSAAGRKYQIFFLFV